MKRVFRIIPYVILALACLFLYRELRHLQWDELTKQFKSYGADAYLGALALLVLNYFVWSLYDWSALKQMKVRVPYVQIFRTTSVAFPITNMVGYSLLTGFATRVKKYEPFGVSVGGITQIILYNLSTWWIGFLFLCGFAIIHAPDGRLFGYSPRATQFLGISLLSVIALYLLACWKFRDREFRWWKICLRLPSLEHGTLKVLVSMIDNLIVALTMFIFMPAADEISYARFLAYFLSANLVALLSFVPAGLGVLETMLLFLFRPYAGDAQILASMVMFRLWHYLLPVALALGSELMSRAIRFKPTRKRLDPSPDPG